MKYVLRKSTGIVVFAWMALVLGSTPISAQTIPDEVLDIFDEKCAFAGCHVGTAAPKGLDLSEDFAYSGLVNQNSGDYGSRYLRVKPQDPARSYLMMKLKGNAIIKGERMPKSSNMLTSEELAAIENWINSLSVTTVKAEAPKREYAEAFFGMSTATLPTTKTLDAHTFSYRIAHRWRGEVGGGIDQFFGLDGGAVMFTELAFPANENLTISIGRTNQQATYELGAKWRFLREKNQGGTPVSAALKLGLDWASVKGLSASGVELGRTDGERFHFYGQLPISKQFNNKLSFLVVPGVLLNGNTQVTDESALITVGFAGRFELSPGFSVFIEGVPIVSGDKGAEVVGGLQRNGDKVLFYDAMTVGLERRVGGHVFHVYVTNSLALATSQYMSGADFDFTKRDLRLGFNIYRTLGFF